MKFSKVKANKNYLHCTVSQKSSSGLYMLSIEACIIKRLNYIDLVDNLQEINAIKSIFNKKYHEYQ